MSWTPIADHALVSDCHGAALIDRSGTVAWWCVPRFEYGLTTPEVERVVRLDRGDELTVAVEHASSWAPLPPAWTRDEIAERLDDTATAWSSWAHTHQRYDGPYAELVSHSGCVLQGLTYQPTGAIVAAATTSLPESVGGETDAPDATVLVDDVVDFALTSTEWAGTWSTSPTGQPWRPR